jgi:hypothetical protein
MNVLTDIIEKDNVKLRVKPQEMIKLYDNLLEYENQLINLEKENPDQSYLIDLNFRNKVYSVSKIFYVGLFYLLNKKYEDVYTIMHHILEKIKEINEFYENHNLSSISFLRELRAFIENLENLVRFIISKSYVKMAREKFESNAKVNTSNKMVVDGEASTKKEKAKIKYHKPIIYDLAFLRFGKLIKKFILYIYISFNFFKKFKLFLNNIFLNYFYFCAFRILF